MQLRAGPNGTDAMQSEKFDPQPLAYSIRQASQVTSIGRTRLFQLIKEGRLEVRRIGSRTIIPAESLRALISGEG